MKELEQKSNNIEAKDLKGRLPSALLQRLSPGDLASLQDRRSFVLTSDEIKSISSEIASTVENSSI